MTDKQPKFRNLVAQARFQDWTCAGCFAQLEQADPYSMGALSPHRAEIDGPVYCQACWEPLVAKYRM